jgi:hypothetical protein
MPLGGAASLSWSGELRLRGDAHRGLPLARGDERREGLLRAVIGADLRFDEHWRVFAEIGTGQVAGERDAAPANQQNDAALQQLFVEARTELAGWTLQATVGRQEFADGPPQLLSVGDGANLHRTWNGVRLAAEAAGYRFGAYDLRATRPGPGTFDEAIDRAERLQGLTASAVLVGAAADAIRCGPFWIHSEDPDFRVGDRQGLDRRDTFGVRGWGRRGRFAFEGTAAGQVGAFEGRDVEAHGLFLAPSLALAEAGWRPRLTAHVDLASGGGSYGAGTVRTFNPLYTSSGYLGEGRFLSLANLLMVAPGFSVSPTENTSWSIEYGFARRLAADDAVYLGGMRAGPGTPDVPGQRIGGLLRVAGRWTPRPGTVFSAGFEHLAAGDVLDRAGLPSGSHAFFSVTVRF